MANKNEAKITFNADVAGFNKAISNANSTMTELRAEMKLNETQMKATGVSVEGLEKKHGLLEAQLKTAESKTEALANKLEVATRTFGENSNEASKLRTQLLNAQTAEEKLRQEVDKAAKALDDHKAASEDTRTATEKLTDTINEQQSDLTALKKKYADLVIEEKENTDEAKQLSKEIADLSDELNENKTKLSQAADKADEFGKALDDAGDSASSASDGFTVAKGVFADLAADAIQAAISKVSEFIGYLAELPEATREARQGMATLDTSFESAGLTTEQATNTWRELYAVFGDNDKATEAASLIAKMADDQQDLNNWVTISTGIFGSYGDSLPVEGLAEAANETSKTGQVTGVLADALNWSSEAAKMFAGYMSEDVTNAEDAFNEALKECTTEEERQALITETLTALYGDAASTYSETADAQIKAKDAAAEQILVENELATAIEPVTTAWQGMKTELLQGITPAITKVSGFFAEHPKLLQLIVIAVTALSVALGAIAITWGIYTAAQWLANSALLAFPGTWIIAAIVGVIAVIAGLIVYWDEIAAACSKAWEWICDACSNAWQWIKDIFSTVGTWFNDNVIQPVVEFFKGLWDGIVGIFESVIGWVRDNWKAIVGFIINPFAGVFIYLYENFEGFRNFVNDIIQKIVGFFKGLWKSVVEIWDKICNAIKIAFQLIGSIINAAFQIITLPFRFIWENCKEYVFAAWEWIKEKISTAINAVKNVISTVMNAIKSVFTTVWNAIKSTVTKVWNSIKNAITTAVNAVKTKVTSIWNSIKTATSTAFNAVKNVVSNVWNNIKSKITTAVNAVKTKVTAVWNSVKTATTTAFNAVKTKVSSIWNGVKSTIANVVNGVKNTVSNVWTSIKTKTSNVFNSLKTTVSNIFTKIKSAITKPINSAKDAVGKVVDKIKDIFNKMKLKFPDIKMPHFKITPKGWKAKDLLEGSVPKLGIEFYAKGGILTKPTIFGFNGNRAMLGGEAGAEAILPIEKLPELLAPLLDRQARAADLTPLVEVIADLASRPLAMNIDGKRFAYATAGATDSVGGIRDSFAGRGLALD